MRTNRNATYAGLFTVVSLTAALSCGREPEARPSSHSYTSAGEIETPAQIAPPRRKRMSEAALAKLREREAFVPRVYHDEAGNSFVGYGHKLLAGEDFSRGITEEEAQTLFEKDVERLVNVSLDKIQVELTPGHIDSIGDFIFRAGPGTFEKDSLPHLNARRPSPPPAP
jgi:GH24 family phage-related lysozyme (muramidase)